MSSYISESSRNSPEIRFDLVKGEFSIKGKSFPENSKKFYAPFMEWIDKNPLPENAVVEMQFDYISSSSVIAVLELIRRMEEKQSQIRIIWAFESGDDDMQNVGLNYKKLSKLNFEFVEYD